MTDAMTDLARRAVACKGFRWMPGMLTTDDERMSDEGWPDYEVMDFGASSVVETVEWRDRAKRTSLPDLQDPATLGCLLALVREAHSQIGLCAIHMSDGQWQVLFRSGYVVGTSEAEALVAAWEAALRRTSNHGPMGLSLVNLDSIADAIERGEHRREEEP